jgi:protein-tyrosine phosphatase/membrane-associated phospholipid phosphatase
LWLLFLAPFFYLTYGTANWLASTRTDVGSFVFDWERSIPFLGWTIFPYWSINAFYGLSLFVCSTRDELDTHGKRLLTAQIVAVTFFVLIPLRFTFEKPELPGGFADFLFEALGAFDKPFNQAPSLHVALLVILWPFYERHVPRWAKIPLHVWFLLIGISVLTTYQHHFIDIPTGALLGLFCLWLWPDGGGSPLAGLRLTQDSRRRSLAFRYAAGAVILAALAIWLGGWGLWLLWPALSLALVALNYVAIGAAGFQKAPDGSMSLAARLLLAPYLLGAFINSRLWTRKDPKSAEVADGVHIGRIPSRIDANGFATIVDLSAELPRLSTKAKYQSLPVLDLTAPPPDLLVSAAELIERARVSGPVLVCCALGYSRSAAAIACWGARSGRFASIEEAESRIRRARPRIVLDDSARTAIVNAATLRLAR